MDVRLAIKVSRDNTGALSALVTELNQGDAASKKAKASHSALSGVLKELESQAGSAKQRVASMTGGLGELAAAAGPAGIAVAVVGAGVVAVASATVAAVQKFAGLSDSLTVMAAKSGMSTTALQEFRNTAGVTTDTITSAITKMQGKLASGDDSFRRLGLSIKDLQAMSPDQAFRSVAAAVGAIENPMRRAAAAQDAFGKGAAENLPFIADGMERARERAYELGGVLDSQTVAAGSRLSSAMADLSFAMGNVVTQFGAAIGKNPELISGIEGIATAIGLVARTVSQHSKELMLLLNIVSGGMTGGLLSTLGGIGRLAGGPVLPKSSGESVTGFVGKGGKLGKGGGYVTDAEAKAAAEAAKKRADEAKKLEDAMFAYRIYVHKLATKEAEAFYKEQERIASNNAEKMLQETEDAHKVGNRETEAFYTEQEQIASANAKKMLQGLKDAEDAKRRAAEKSADIAGAMADGLNTLANAFMELGMSADSGMVRVVSAMSAGMAGFEAMKRAQTSYQKVAVAGEQALSIYSSNKTNRSGTSAALSGAAQGAAVGAAFGPSGIVVGAVAGGLIGYFSGSGWRKVTKEAGRVLGVDVSDELMKAIQATQSKLNVTLQNAALLNLSGAMAESQAAGGNMRDFADETQRLMASIKDGSVPAAQGLSQVGQAFEKIAAEAMEADIAGDQALRRLIRTSRELGLQSKEIKAFLHEQMGSITSGLGGAFGANGIALIDEQSARDQGAIFAVSFWAAVGQEGYVAAADAFRGTFDTLKESMAGFLSPEDLMAVMGPIERIMNLTQESSAFRGATEGAKGLADVLAGLANSDIPLTIDQFSAFERQAEVARQQAIAGGATEAESYLAIGPLLQRLVETSRSYGIELDDQTRAMLEQAEAAGVAFKTDPFDRAAEAMERMARVLERIYGVSSEVNDEFDRMDRGGGGGGPQPPRGIAPGEPAPGTSMGGFAHGGIVSGPASGYWATLRMHGTEAITPVSSGWPGGSSGATDSGPEIQALAQQVGLLAQQVAISRSAPSIEIMAAPLTIEATAMGEGVIEERALRAMRDALWSGNQELIESVRHALG